MQATDHTHIMHHSGVHILRILPVDNTSSMRVCSVCIGGSACDATTVDLTLDDLHRWCYPCTTRALHARPVVRADARAAFWATHLSLHLVETRRRRVALEKERATYINPCSFHASLRAILMKY